jgi:hypothetical protein
LRVPFTRLSSIKGFQLYVTISVVVMQCVITLELCDDLLAEFRTHSVVYDPNEIVVVKNRHALFNAQRL